MSTFGDFDSKDALDTEPPDPLQVAIKLHKLRVNHGLEMHSWEDLSDADHERATTLAAALIAWLLRQGALR